jgi:glycosyltransferase involved in cell wall biosynthesis
VKISLYTGVKDGLFYDFHVEAMLRHHLPLADEIIVNEGLSTDGTYEVIASIDPKIKVHRFEWDRSDPLSWHRKFKNQARQLCTGDWCILLDCDEFIPEWEFERLRELLATTSSSIIPVRFKHFYGSYKVVMATLPTIIPELGHRIHRNREDIEVWGDGANVAERNGSRDILPASAAFAFEVHHFGSVRRPSRLRQKWRTQAKQHNEHNPRWDTLPSFVFDLFPHKWKDPDVLDNLAIYEGPYIRAVRDNPDEFVRDDFAIYRYLKSRSHGN